MCIDREEYFRSVGEIWNGGIDECIFYKCLEDGNIIFIEFVCEEEFFFICERIVEVVIGIVDKLICCFKKVCGMYGNWSCVDIWL